MTWAVTSQTVAEPLSSPAGHRSGAIEVPGKALQILVDLENDGGGWQARIAIPAQGAEDWFSGGGELAETLATRRSIGVFATPPGESSL